MKTRLFLPVAFSLASLLPSLESRAVDYQEEIRPILNEKCFKCHSGPRAKGKLRMDSEDHFSGRIGGDDPVIVPGNAAESLLAVKAGLPRSDGDAMPPPPARSRGAEPMTTAELNLVKQWIQAGASFEEGGAPTEVTSAETESGEPSESMEPEMLQWTNHEGNSLTAAFVRAEGTNVVLLLEDGKEIPYPFAKLSGESQELARKLATQ